MARQSTRYPTIPLPLSPALTRPPQFQAAADALDAKLWITTFFRPDATVNFAGNCPLIGHEEIIASMGAALGGLEKMKHVFVSLLSSLKNSPFIS